MAKNREPEHVDSGSESGEEETEEDEEETSDEVESEPEPEPEQNQTAKKPSCSAVVIGRKPQPQSSSKAPRPNSSSSEEEEEDSGSDSEPESGGPPQNVRPLASRPMEDLQKSKPKAKTAEPSTPVKAAGAKRSAAEEKEAVEKESKKPKKKVEPDTSEKKTGDSSKKVLFQRLWSEDDELVILKGILDYTANFGSNPLSDLDAFHNFIRKNLHVDGTKTQLQDKIRRLRKKYENNNNKGKEGFSKAHEQKAFELSRKIWGTNNGKGIQVEKAIGSPKANGGTARKNSGKRALANVIEIDKAKDANDIEVSHGNLDNPAATKRVCFGDRSGHDRILSIGAEFFEGYGMVEGQMEWKKLMKEEIELHLKRLDLMRAQAKLVLDVVKSKNN